MEVSRKHVVHSLILLLVGLALFVPSALEINYGLLGVQALRSLPVLVGVLGLALILLGVRTLGASR